MKNIWIIHNSKHGNSEKLSNEIADGLKDKFNVKVDSIKALNPKEFVGYNPDALIIGARIIALNTDRKLTKFIKNLDSYIKEPIPKIGTFYTHMLQWKDRFSRGLRKALEKSTCIGDLCPEILEVTMEKQKGPAAESQEETIQNYINMLINYIEE